MNQSIESKPEALVGFEVPAANGDDHGLKLIGFDAASGEYITRSIRWSTGVYLDEIVRTMTPFRLLYRYMPDEARPFKRPADDNGKLTAEEELVGRLDRIARLETELAKLEAEAVENNDSAMVHYLRGRIKHLKKTIQSHKDGLEHVVE